MQINMTTLGSRKLHYIDQTLSSLFESDWREVKVPVNLILGSEDETHVQKFASHPLIRIVPWDLERLPEMRSNCTLNKIRALSWGDDETTLICEDDIVFNPTWYADLERAAAELAGEDYVLSLFAAVPDLERASLVEGKTLIKRYPIATLQGAQALYYPSRKLRGEAADYLRRRIGKASGDVLIGQYAMAQAALYATRNILVDHIGQVSCFH